MRGFKTRAVIASTETSGPDGGIMSCSERLDFGEGSNRKTVLKLLDVLL